MSALAPWQQRALAPALAALAEGRLGHALLFSGPAGMGKAAVADVLARRLLCTTPGADGLACGQCRGCRLYEAGTHPDARQVGLLPNDRGDKLRTELVVDQMRELGQWFALTPQLCGAQVAVIAPAHALNASAANALLKTLEEPARDRYLLLVSDHAGRLPATIRSRCQRIEFRPPPRDEALAWLQSRGHAAAAATEALDAARGHPGAADAWLSGGGLALRAEVASALASLASGRASPVDTARDWLADEQAALRLGFAAELALDAAARGLGACPPAPRGLTAPADFQKLSAWFDAINRARSQLASPLRHDLALAGLLLDWRRMFQDTNAGAGR